MSLTRDEWCKMWEQQKQIEMDIHELYVGRIVFEYKVYYRILSAIENTKKQIQSVVGQME